MEGEKSHFAFLDLVIRGPANHGQLIRRSGEAACHVSVLPVTCWSYASRVELTALGASGDLN